MYTHEHIERFILSTATHAATHAATHCNTHCNTLQHSLQHTLQHTATLSATHTATHTATQTTTHCNTHCITYCNTHRYREIRTQHMLAYRTDRTPPPLQPALFLSPSFSCLDFEFLSLFPASLQATTQHAKFRRGLVLPPGAAVNVLALQPVAGGLVLQSPCAVAMSVDLCLFRCRSPDFLRVLVFAFPPPFPPLQHTCQHEGVCVRTQQLTCICVCGYMGGWICVYVGSHVSVQQAG